MSNPAPGMLTALSEPLMLARLEQSDRMREFFVQMWLQNPLLANQGGARVMQIIGSPFGSSENTP